MFAVVVPVLNQHETTCRLMQTWFDLAKNDFEILFIDNGSDEPLSEQQFFKRWQKDLRGVRIVRNDQNVGVYPTFQQGLEKTDKTFIFYSHNDVEMKVPGWDEILSRRLASLCWSDQKPGVCGMFGARRIGTPDIYRAPYHFTQMMRGDCITVQSMLDAGARLVGAPYERVVVLDGFSLIVYRKMVRDVMGYQFDHERFPVHHMYDIDICVTSHCGGFSNFVLDIDCRHHGGVTSTRERWAEKFGTTDFKIHREAHRVFYEKWRGKLPIEVR